MFWVDYPKLTINYLGDFIHGGGGDKSAEVTVVERCGRMRRMFSTNNEKSAIVEDCRSTTLGGLMVRLDI